jgi:hypothetical protein
MQKTLAIEAQSFDHPDDREESTRSPSVARPSSAKRWRRAGTGRRTSNRWPAARAARSTTSGSSSPAASGSLWRTARKSSWARRCLRHPARPRRVECRRQAQRAARARDGRPRNGDAGMSARGRGHRPDRGGDLVGGAEWDPVRPLLAPMDLSTDRRHAPPRSQGRTARNQTGELLRCQLPPSRSSKASLMTRKPSSSATSPRPWSRSRARHARSDMGRHRRGQEGRLGDRRHADQPENASDHVVAVATGRGTRAPAIWSWRRARRPQAVALRGSGRAGQRLATSPALLLRLPLPPGCERVAIKPRCSRPGRPAPAQTGSAAPRRFQERGEGRAPARGLPEVVGCTSGVASSEVHPFDVKQRSQPPGSFEDVATVSRRRSSGRARGGAHGRRASPSRRSFRAVP